MISRLSGLFSLIAAGVVGQGCASAPAPVLASATQLQTTPSISGMPPTPLARAGQTLPLEAERRIAFETNELTFAPLDIAPDSSVIVFDTLGDIYSVAVGGGKAKALTRGMAFDSQPVFNPDGSRILFLSDRSGAENLWTMASDGSDLKQISFYDDDPIWVSPEWSRDGETVYVSRFRPDRNVYELWRFAANGDAVGTPVVNKAEIQTLGVQTLPDGDLILARSEVSPDFATAKKWGLKSRSAATGTEQTLLPAPDGESRFNPRLSPDGTQLAFAARRGDETWLRIAQLSTGAARDLLRMDPDNLQASMWMGIVPRFDFLDNKTIIVNTGGKLQRVSTVNGMANPLAVTLDIDQPVGPLVRAPYRLPTGNVPIRLAQDPAFLGNGDIVFSGLGRLYRSDGKSSSRLFPENHAPSFHPDVSPDGKFLAFVTWADAAGGSVEVVDLRTRKIRQIVSGDFYTHPVFSPDGTAIYVIASPAQDRRETYKEWRQFREAALLRIDLATGKTREIATGQMGGIPHWSADGETLYLSRPEGAVSISTDGIEAPLLQVKGPSWYFVEDSSFADDIRIHPSEKLALVKINQQLWAVPFKQAGAKVELSEPGKHRRISAIGADFFGFTKDGRSIWWSAGQSLKTMPLSLAATSIELDPMLDRTPLAIEYAQQVETRALSASLPRDNPQGSILLTGANILTMGPQGRIASGDILVSGSRITGVGKSGSLNVPVDTKVVSLAGQYVIPGLIDMHYHAADIRRDVLQFDPWGPCTALSFGVTTLFDPSTLSIDMLAYSDAADAGLSAGARILSTGPAMPSYNDFRSRAEVGYVLDRYAKAYKLHNLKLYRSGNRRVRQWIAEEAVKQGLTTTTEGTMSRKLGLTQIIDGFSGVEHVQPPRRMYDDALQLYARSGTSYATTLMITNGGTPGENWFAQRDLGKPDIRMQRFMPQWRIDFLRKKIMARPNSDPGFIEQAQSAKKFIDMGGLLAIGSHGDYSGIDTHWEMQAHAMGGLTPRQTLLAATLNAAKAIGNDADLGSLEPGKIADMVILSRDPDTDIANALSATAVMKAGRLFSVPGTADPKKPLPHATPLASVCAVQTSD